MVWDGKEERRLNGSIEKQRITRLEALVDATKELFLTKMEAQERALTLARQINDAHLDVMNNFRSDMQRLEGSFVTKESLDIILKPIIEDIRMLRESKSMLEGKASQFSVNIALLFSLLGVVVSIIGLL